LAEILTNSHQDESTDQHDNSLNEIRPNDSRQSACDGEKGSDGQKDQDRDVQSFISFESHGLFDENGTREQVSLPIKFQ
jgi:hypothetical protein